MGKPKKRRQKYQYSRNRRKEWQKSKKMPTISCKQIKEAWDEKKSINQNLKAMGIASDPNAAIPLPKAKDLLGKTFEEVQLKDRKKQPDGDTMVVQELVTEANIPQPRRVRLSQPEVSYCTYMMQKYGEDYKAMARDPKNHYQETPKQIRRKINTFKSIPEQYNAYLESINSGSSG